MAKFKLITDQDYLPQALRVIASAKNTIDILSFSFAIGSTQGKLSKKQAPYEIAMALVKAKKKNPKLKIRFYTEGFRETNLRNRITASFLKNAKVQIKFGATHAKGFCADEKTVLFGSTNLTNQSITKNHEANLLINEIHIAKEFTKYFNHLWRGGKHGGIKLEPPLLADGDFKKALVDLIHSAKKSIFFSIYFFNHSEIEEALIAAHKRKVKIDCFIHQHASFALYYIYKNRATIKRLNETGIKNITWGRPYLFSHAKYLVSDHENIFLSTGNWLKEDEKIHPQLSILFKDKKIAKDLNSHFKLQIKRVLKKSDRE